MSPSPSRESGQALMISVLLLIVLLLATSSIVLLNKTTTHHSIMSVQRGKGRAISDEATAFAIQQFVTQLTGSNGLNFGCPANFNGTTVFSSAQGGSYTINCTVGPEAYQRQILVKPLDSVQRELAGTAVLTTLSQKTVGAKLPKGMGVSAALEVLNTPSTPGTNLYIYNGPIVCHDGNTLWTLDANSDGQRYPRKYSAAGIKGTPPPPNLIRSETAPDKTVTDYKEFWAYTDVGFATVINTDIVPATSYKNKAQTGSACAALPICQGPCAGVGGPGNPIPANPGGSCYFPVAAGDTALFDVPGAAPALGYTGPGAADEVLYIDGDAIFKHVTIDVSNGGAVIVTGKLTIQDTRDNTGGPYAIVMSRCPTIRCLDDPYTTPCPQAGRPSSCISPYFFDIKGFVYVKGDMLFNGNTQSGIDGVLRVDGQMTVQTGLFALAYNDVVNHNVRTTNYEVQIDTFIAAP